MKRKLQRFAENETFSHVLQPSREAVLAGLSYRGKWSEAFFENKAPIVLELGCGKGEYTIGLARRNPHINYIGIDVKGSRFWRGAKTAQEENLKNVGFIRTQIELVAELFAPNEIHAIWITFPDPQIKYRRAKHRLTHPIFLERYRTILEKNGHIHLKTDSEFLHGYTHGILQLAAHPIHLASTDVYHPRNAHIPKEVTEIQTFYENQFREQGKKITYIDFQLKGN